MARVQLDMNSILLKSLKASIPEVEGVLTEVMEEGAEKYIDIFRDLVPDSIKDATAGMSASDPDVTKFTSHATGWYKRGRIDITVNIPEEDVQRPSFGSSGPLDNILLLFDQGYYISGKLPAGEWHGEKHVARRSRPGLYFFDQANAIAYAEIEGLAKIERN